MRHSLLATIALLTAVPTLGAQTIGPKKDRYELTVARPATETFALAIRALTDSSFRTTAATVAPSVIQTEWRRPGDNVEDGLKAAAKRTFGNQKPVRLNIVLTPVGTDSTRVTVRGDLLLENIDRSLPIRTHEKNAWAALQGIGDALLALAAPAASAASADSTKGP